MQFTRLRLQGFKSFVDPTELVIEEGLTAVIGPNGCGKSNLLEAIRWVMGENRPTAMRGSGMEDVIFAGSASRPARNAANVQIHVDNRARLAPPGLGDADELEISRRITRDIGSAYHVNGRPARARDVQMLFADASTGAHSPALVRQGQIGEMINAKPQARRRILEEAAGIAGLHQRRHEAELKLNQAEQNLARVADLVEGLDGQLKSLARQAGQARRYREIAEALRAAEATLLLARWRAARDERDRAAETLAEAVRASARAETAEREAGRAREAADAALPPLREEAAVAGAGRQRLEMEEGRLAEEEARARAEIERLEARVAQLAGDLEREERLGGDAGRSIAALDEEAARLSEASGGHGAARAEALAGAETAEAALAEAEARHDRLATEAARLAAEAEAAEKRNAAARGRCERLAGEIAKAEAERAGLESARAEAAGAERAASARLAEARAEAGRAEAALAEAETALSEAETADRAARAARAEAEGRAQTLAAEAASLETLLAEEAGEGPALLDAVTVTPGREAALGAALGEDLEAPEAGGAGVTGWRGLGPLDPAPALPEGAAPLAGEVAAPPVLARRLAQVGIVVDAAEGERLQPALAPGQRLVSPAGDLWRWDGYARAAADAPSAAARRLAQRNRLAALGASLEEARAAEASARSAQEASAARLAEARSTLSEARAARKEADAAQAAASRAASAAESERARLESRAAAQEEQLAERREAHAAAETERAEAGEALAALDDPEAARAATAEARAALDAARTGAGEARARVEELDRAERGRRRRLEAIANERAGWERRAAEAGDRIADVARRRDAAEAERRAAADRPGEIAARRAALSDEMARARTREARAGDALAEGESALREADRAAREAGREASEAREARGRLEGLAEAAEGHLAEAAEAIEAELGESAEALAERLGPEAAAADPKAAETEVQKLRRQRDALGAVNLRAEEDAREVEAERDRLLGEKADLEGAVERLRAGIRELNREGRQRLTGAFEEVNRRFAELFRHLFGGGEARLVMVESEDPLEAGLEILCQPPGKKLATLSLLSGGEQTLTALSLILAVFLTNPAPICVLDEVDAPLDDSNVVRFCNLLDRMVEATETRFLIITHNPITMSRMDRLFGVTMVEQGVSQLVSVDLSRAREMAGE